MSAAPTPCPWTDAAEKRYEAWRYVILHAFRERRCSRSKNPPLDGFDFSRRLEALVHQQQEALRQLVELEDSLPITDHAGPFGAALDPVRQTLAAYAQLAKEMGDG